MNFSKLINSQNYLKSYRNCVLEICHDSVCSFSLNGKSQKSNFYISLSYSANILNVHVLAFHSYLLPPSDCQFPFFRSLFTISSRFILGLFYFLFVTITLCHSLIIHFNTQPSQFLAIILVYFVLIINQSLFRYLFSFPVISSCSVWSKYYSKNPPFQ